MSLGSWAAEVATGNETCMDLLDGVPGPLCSKIDKWTHARGIGSRSKGGTKLERVGLYDNIEDLWATADTIADERDAAFEGLEECRTALERLRAALESACFVIRDLEAQRDVTVATEIEPTADDLAGFAMGVDLQ